MLRLLAPAALLLLAAPAYAETCVDRPGGQFADNAKLCVSSVLKPQGANAYGPENLNGDSPGAWCEGAPGTGQGEYIRITFGNTVTFRTLMIGNGYAKSKTAFFNNARARTVRIETGDGLSFAAELKDNDALQNIRLPRVVRSNSVRLTVVDVYGGDKHQDMCMHFFWPNFEEMNR
jgi:hypothetical protein